MKVKREVEFVTTPVRDVVLVCRKCAGKLDGGFGDDGSEGLDRVLKHGLRAAGMRREVRIVRVGCLGVCPKKAVTVVVSGRPGEMIVVPAHTSIEELLPRLSLSARSRTPAPDPSGTP